MGAPLESRAGERGFTFAEVLVALMVSMIVLFATLKSLDAFTTSATRQTRVTAANEQVRAVMDSTVADLRGASVIVRADANDLVYAVPTAGGSRIERLCVASGYLYRDATVTPTVAAPGSGCASGTKVAALRATANTAFTYDGASSSSTPAHVKDVGLTFSLDASHGAHSASSTLQASAARRSAAGTSLPVGEGDVNATCNGNQPVLSLSASLPGVSALTVTYATTGGVALGSATGTNGVQIAAGVSVVVGTVTDALGVTKKITRSVECAS